MTEAQFLEFNRKRLEPDRLPINGLVKQRVPGSLSRLTKVSRRGDRGVREHGLDQR